MKNTNEEVTVTTPYIMITAELHDNNEITFKSDEEFKEAIQVGFFRIKAPEGLDLAAAREFAKNFTSMPKYNQFGALDVVNGYLQSEYAQTVRFTLERDNWDKTHVNKEEIANGEPNYPLNIQDIGHKMHNVGIRILKYILKKFNVPENLQFKATGGCAEGEGSNFLLFNCYDPKLGTRSDGVGAHKDWSHITVLDATQPGLQALINGEWRDIAVEDGYLTINFGYPLEKLLPGVNASMHRVITQKEEMRVSVVSFLDPRVGPFRKGVEAEDSEGYVYDWDSESQTLVNGQSTLSFFTALSNQLYGTNQEAAKEDKAPEKICETPKP